MDLTDILRKRTETDLRVATARTLEISLEIKAASAELKELRSKLRGLENSAKTKQPPEQAAQASAHRPAAPGRPRSPGLLQRLMRRRARPALIHWHLDEISGVPPLRDEYGVNAEVSHTGLRSLTLSGWVVPIEGAPSFASAGIALVGKERRIAREIQTHSRADVAAHFENQDYVSSGFRFDIPMFEIPTGIYSLEISARNVKGQQVLVHAGTIEIAE